MKGFAQLQLIFLFLFVGSTYGWSIFGTTTTTEVPLPVEAVKPKYMGFFSRPPKPAVVEDALVDPLVAEAVVESNQSSRRKWFSKKSPISEAPLIAADGIADVHVVEDTPVKVSSPKSAWWKWGRNDESEIVEAAITKNSWYASHGIGDAPVVVVDSELKKLAFKEYFTDKKPGPVVIVDSPIKRSWLLSKGVKSPILETDEATRVWLNKKGVDVMETPAVIVGSEMEKQAWINRNLPTPPVEVLAEGAEKVAEVSWWQKHMMKSKGIESSAAVPPVVMNGPMSPIPGTFLRVPTQLKNIYVSHGDLDPSFRPDHKTYTLVLNQPHDQIAVVPEIMQEGLGFLREADMPIVHMTWKGNKDAFPESASVAMRKQIDLPDDGGDLKVTISIADPHDSSNYDQYKVHIKQLVPPLPMLKFLDGVDNYGDSVLVDPVPSQDSSIYNVCVNPRATKITLMPGCNTDSKLRINGHSHHNGKPITLHRERDYHTQVVEVACGSGHFGSALERKYALLVKSDWLIHEMNVPRLVVDNLGKECVFETKDNRFVCPDPKTSNGKVRIISFNEPSIKYTIENSRKTTEVRLLHNVPSIPFTYANNLRVVAEGCQYVQEWPITFGGTAVPGLMQLLGWILAIVLAVLIVTLLIMVGAASLCGIGVPIGGTEIAATMTLIVQYFCFANFMRGSTILTEMVMPLKWVTLFWPLPWHVGDSLRRSLLDMGSLSSAYGLELWGDSSLGDVTDIRNACGCLFWCLVAFCCLLLIHAFAYVKFMLVESDHTFPHRVKLGNWESRCLHWLAFPNCTAAAMVLSADITTTTWKILAGITLGVYVGWISVVLFSIQSAVGREKVCWVWNSSVREDGELEDESGYWSDVICDQLVTQPVNRGLWRGFFPYKWISTCADIEPVSVCQAVFERTKLGEDVYPPQHYSRGHKEALYPLGKNPKTVEVLRARAACGMCKGSRLIAGLFRTQWLDVLFTYQGLAKVHDSMRKESGRNVIIPLTVKTSQLSGPLAAGPNAFFFDGARIPFIRLADAIFRVLLGVFVGVALACEGYKGDAAMFALVVACSAGLLAYVAATKPYSRKFENWMIVTAMGIIALSGCSFCYYAIVRKDPAWIADVFLWVTALGCFALGAYSCFVTFTVFSAFICPPLEESQFLERLANCGCTISDHHAGWAVDMPAYSKFGVKDLKAQCTLSSGDRVHVSIFPSGEEPSFEFSTQEIRHACRSGTLEPPYLAIFAPALSSPLGYRHHNVTDKRQVEREVARFLESDAAIAPIAGEVARHVTHHAELKSRNKTILSVTVVPPKGFEHTAISTASYSNTTRSSKSSASSSSRRRSRSKSSKTY